MDPSSPSDSAGSSPFAAEPTPAPSDSTPAAPPGLTALDIWHAVTRRLYSSNPFYILGALLVFVGLRMSFDTEAAATTAASVVTSYPTERLLLLLGIFTTFTALFAFGLIRWGQVWDDVRSLLLLVLLLIVGMSVTLDQIVATDLQRGLVATGLMWLYALAIVALLTRGLRMRFAWPFALPLILLLTTIIGYPVLIKSLLEARHESLVKLLLAFYPTLGGLVALTLLPAVRLGPTLAEPNGTPWRWPLYPWSLFVMLGCGFVGRAYYLCLSFGIGGGKDHFFGPYLLAPLLLAVLMLVLEEALRRRDRDWQWFVLLVAFSALFLSAYKHDTTFGLRFWNELSDTLHCTWFHLVAWMLVAFQAWGVCRRAEGATWGLSAALLLLAGIRPEANSLYDQIFGLPLILLAGLQLVLAVRHERAARAWCAIVVGLVGVHCQWPEWELTQYHGLLVVNMLLVATWLVTAWFRDRSVAWIHTLNIVLTPLVAWHGLATHDELAAPFGDWIWYGHGPTVALIALAHSFVVHPRRYRVSSVATLSLWSYLVVGDDFWRFRAAWPGCDLILAGTAALAIAVGISIRKGLRYRAESRVQLE